MDAEQRPARKVVRHAPPPHVHAGEIYFLTICAVPRGSSHLVEKAEILLSAARHYHEHRRWWMRLMILMPDHLHALVAFPANETMARCVGDWKRFTARKTGVVWQKDFFDHRIRDEANLQLKADYIRENPVRAGLVKCQEDWPWKMEPVGPDLRAGRE